MTKTIIITGGAGFIGSNLCRYFLDRNDSVICIDDLSTGQYTSIVECLKDDNFRFVKTDITKKLTCELPEKVDEIYHLACPASPPMYQKNPMKTINTSLFGTYNMMKLCKKYRCKMLFSSTSEIYGNPLVHPQPETYYGNVNTVGPRSCYDESKRMCETMIYEYRKKHNLDIKIIRIFNTYGPYMNINDGRVITNFIKSIMTENTVFIFGDGNQTRSFCYIDDLIDGFIKMMNSGESGPINLGNPSHELTINQLVDVFESIYNREIKRVYLKANKDDPLQRKPDITKANTLLNWKPCITLQEGLSKTINYHKLKEKY